MKKLSALGLYAACIMLSPTCASALPGESAQSVMGRLMQTKRFTIKQGPSLNSDLLIYNATTRWRGADLVYSFGNDPSGRIKSETIAWEKSHFSFKKSLISVGIVRLAAGAVVARDFESANVVATTKTHHSSLVNLFYRGRAFGYVSSGTLLLIVRLADLPTAIKQARLCETRDCGD